MKLSISNIAWDSSDDLEVVELLTKYGVRSIDIAPTKYFPNPKDASTLQIAGVLEWWLSKGIEIEGMQSLLYGTKGLNVFSDSDVQDRMLNYLDKICYIGSELDARKLVFGSPKNRDKGNLDITKANDLACSFFNRLGDIAGKRGVTICLEPNPEVYGCNFLTNTFETIDFVRKVNHSSIKLQLDTGAINMKDESLECILNKSKGIVGHIHLSEPNLSIIGDCDTDHQNYARSFSSHNSDFVATIEMLPPKNDNKLEVIDRALAFTVENYSNNEKIQ